MVAQRRYSVTGQTPANDAEAMARSPKLHALDTSAPTMSRGLCDGAAEAGKLATAADDSTAELRGRTKTAQAGTVRTSSKRSATQLPSPAHELPPKILRYQRGCDDMDVDMHTDTSTDAAAAAAVDAEFDADADTDSDVTDVFYDGSEREDDTLGFESQATSVPSTPEYSLPSSACSLPDTASLEHLQLCASSELADDDDDDDDCMEDLALSPPHSRNHSVDRTWTVCLPSEPAAAHIEHADPLTANHTSAPLTFLTLPPEIRHHVYRHCNNLVIEKPLVYCISTFDGEMQHPLAAVSRQVRSEALAIFYSYNTWVIKVEFRIMYEAFRDWIIRLGHGASLLRLVSFSVRGALFKPRRTHIPSVALAGTLVQTPPGGVTAPGAVEDLYCPPDGDASFKIDLSEKFIGGRVQLVRNDGTQESGEQARVYLGKLVEGLWEKRRIGMLNGQDWVTMADNFIGFIGGW